MPLQQTVMCLTSLLFFSMVAAVLFTDWIQPHHVMHNDSKKEDTCFLSAFSRSSDDFKAGPVCTQIKQTARTHNYLGKSSSCHSSLTSMLSMRKEASAVPILWEDGLQLTVGDEQIKQCHSMGNQVLPAF